MRARTLLVGFLSVVAGAAIAVSATEAQAAPKQSNKAVVPVVNTSELTKTFQTFYNGGVIERATSKNGKFAVVYGMLLIPREQIQMAPGIDAFPTGYSMDVWDLRKKQRVRNIFEDYTPQTKLMALAIADTGKVVAQVNADAEGQLFVYPWLIEERAINLPPIKIGTGRVTDISQGRKGKVNLKIERTVAITVNRSRSFYPATVPTYVYPPSSTRKSGAGHELKQFQMQNQSHSPLGVNEIPALSYRCSHCGIRQRFDENHNCPNR